MQADKGTGRISPGFAYIRLFPEFEEIECSVATTQRYIGIEPQRIEQAIQNHAQLL